jgi:hypothetical protein
MTGSNDLDRMLASYLDDGPRRAPERAMDAAVAFAAAHPRRRDPLLFLKPDVMARRGSLFGPHLVWAALLVALTLGAVAAIAIGTRPTQEPVVPPSVVESPSPSSSPSPSIEPSPSPQTFSVVVTDEHDIDHPVEVIDASGQVVTVEAGPAYAGPEIGDAAATSDPQSDTRVFIIWAFTGCDDPTSIEIGATASDIVVERPACQGDAIGGNPHQVTLTFAGPVDASALDVQLIETPAAP